MKKIIKRLGLAVLGLVGVGVVIFVVWANLVYRAEAEKLATASNAGKNDYRITEKADYWEIIPNSSDFQTANYKNAGLIFYPGAKVAPEAYFYKLSMLANGEAGRIKVFITKPTLNLAVFGVNQADQVIAEHPEIKRWIIGGHSLGGAMSCEYAKSHAEKVGELWLFAAYCNSDISKLNLKVVSIYGSRDGVLNFQRLAENRNNLPAAALNFEIQGMNHAQIGNYGFQSGDNEPAISDDEARREISKIFNDLFSKSDEAVLSPR